ncbi:hypothetical protein V6C27_12655 [Peptococcaceae bacterium 1198_IL3148]
MLNKLIASKQEVALHYTDGPSAKYIYGYITEIDEKMMLIKIVYNQRECIFPLSSVVRIEPVLDNVGGIKKKS